MPFGDSFCRLGELSGTEKSKWIKRLLDFWCLIFGKMTLQGVWVSLVVLVTPETAGSSDGSCSVYVLPSSLTHCDLWL